MYNENKKNLYFSNMDIKETTKESYARLFDITEKHETESRKDISEFTFVELEKVLYDFNANNRNTMESYARIISGYLNWCKDNGLIKKNLLSNLKPNDFEKYLTNQEEYMTEEQLTEIEKDCVNYQDKVVLRLIFEGVGGKQWSEISNLRKQDVDFEGKKLSLRESESKDSNKYLQRWLPVSDHLLELIQGAIDETEYQKKNGKGFDDNDGRILDYTKLVNNEYVVRPSNTKEFEDNIPCNQFVLYRRITTISKQWDMEYLTAKYLQRSGMVHYANTLSENGLSVFDLKMVAERFGIKSYHNLKGFLKMKKEV